MTTKNTHNQCSACYHKNGKGDLMAYLHEQLAPILDKAMLPDEPIAINRVMAAYLYMCMSGFVEIALRDGDEQRLVKTSDIMASYMQTCLDAFLSLAKKEGH